MTRCLCRKKNAEIRCTGQTYRLDEASGCGFPECPLDKETQFIAIVGQFYHPDEQSNSWRLVLKRDELEADRPRTIELMRSDLRLLPFRISNRWQHLLYLKC